MLSLIVTLLYFCVSADTTIVDLNDENFSDQISALDWVMVEFYAPWCPFCKAMKPEFERAAAQSQYQFGRVDVPKNDRLAL